MAQHWAPGQKAPFTTQHSTRDMCNWWERSADGHEYAAYGVATSRHVPSKGHGPASASAARWRPALVTQYGALPQALLSLRGRAARVRGRSLPKR